MLLTIVYVSNHFINAIILRFFGADWQNSLYGGALLAQVGELSFIVAATGFYTSIIEDYGYQIVILIISLTLLVSPVWILLTKRIIHYKTQAKDEVGSSPNMFVDK